jgi:hypothetical protein
MATMRPSERRRLTISLLLVGQDVGLDIVDAKASGDGLGGHAVVAGQHDDVDARCSESFQRIGRGDLDRIGDADRAGHAAVHPDEDRGRAFGAQVVGLRPSRFHRDTLFFEKAGIAATSLRPSTVPVIPLPTG